jgi:hypothetical protein
MPGSVGQPRSKLSEAGGFHNEGSQRRLADNRFDRPEMSCAEACGRPPPYPAGRSPLPLMAGRDPRQSGFTTESSQLRRLLVRVPAGHRGNTAASPSLTGSIPTTRRSFTITRQHEPPKVISSAPPSGSSRASAMDLPPLSPARSVAGVRPVVSGMSASDASGCDCPIGRS